MANKPNRVLPKTALTHSRWADFTNMAYITPKFFIPKKPLNRTYFTRFRIAQRKGKLPYLSYDSETCIFVAHGFENECDNDDCMNLILKMQLVPMARIYTRNTMQSELLFYIPPEDVYFYSANHYKSKFRPGSIAKVMKPHEYDELKIMSDNNSGPKKKPKRVNPYRTLKGNKYKL